MFVDVAKVDLTAGKGGDGAVSFRHEIYIPKGGPDGGNGGRGGNIIFMADKDTNTLLDFRYNPILKAENGKPGAGQRAAGRAGKDLIVKVPIGTLVYKINPATSSSPESTTLITDLTSDGQTAIVAKGGAGGFGNAHFKSSTRQTPKIAELGEPGESFTAKLELKLLADVGLVGLPNAGKSTFLSVVTNAQPEIANYPFTTITPNLGVATIDGRDLLLADIPGLIAGASEGKGLGHAFLRHIDRTAVLLHLIDVYNEDAGTAYATVRQELSRYSDLKHRPEMVALTKVEGLDQDIITMQKTAILAKNPKAQIFAISSQSHQGINDLLRALSQAVASHPASSSQPLNSSTTQPDSLDLNPSVSPATSPDTPPVITLSDKQLKNTWTVSKENGIYVVTGEKIEKFARRTDPSNYASLNRLRDIMKKLGIRAELTTQGAQPDSLIRIADKEFPLVEQLPD